MCLDGLGVWCHQLVEIGLLYLSGVVEHVGKSTSEDVSEGFGYRGPQRAGKVQGCLKSE
jgi:hypothetical protein